MSTPTLETRFQPINNPSAIPPQLGRPFFDYVAGFMFEVFLYGINTTLVVAALYALFRKTSGRARHHLLVPAVMMFTIATANACLSVYMLFGLLISGTNIPKSVVRTKHMFYLFNNLIGDTLLISRCYSAWSRSIYVIVLPSVILLVSSIFGLITMSRPNINIGPRKYIYLWLTLFLNVSVTALTAGRIWWMARKAKKILGSGLANKYYSAVAIIIESGALYSSYVLLDQILITFQIHSFVLDAGLAQIVVTSPTLIIVQIGLGQQIRDLDSTIQRSRETSVILSTAYSDAMTGHRTTTSLHPISIAQPRS